MHKSARDKNGNLSFAGCSNAGGERGSRKPELGGMRIQLGRTGR